MLYVLGDVHDEADEAPVGKCGDSADDLYFVCEGDRNVGISDSG